MEWYWRQVCRDINIRFEICYNLVYFISFNNNNMIWHTAQICFNGHIITHSLELNPESNSPFCKDCGAKTVSACQSCNANIRGIHFDPGGFTSWYYEIPSFCYNCGEPFPWTTEKLKLANEIIFEEVSLTPDEKIDFESNLKIITTDNPRTEYASSKVKEYLKKFAVGTGKILRDVITDVASETAKKILFPDGK